jgi:hypothetical protein
MIDRRNHAKRKLTKRELEREFLSWYHSIYKPNGGDPDIAPEEWVAYCDTLPFGYLTGKRGEYMEATK